MRYLVIYLGLFLCIVYCGSCFVVCLRFVLYFDALFKVVILAAAVFGVVVVFGLLLICWCFLFALWYLVICGG